MASHDDVREGPFCEATAPVKPHRGLPWSILQLCPIGREMLLSLLSALSTTETVGGLGAVGSVRGKRAAPTRCQPRLRPEGPPRSPLRYSRLGPVGMMRGRGRR